MISRIAVALLFTLALFAQGNPEDDKLYNKVRMKLAESPEVNGGAIDVAVQGGNVTLKGRVLKEKQRTKAAQVAKKVKGVKSVDNQLTVDATSGH